MKIILLMVLGLSFLFGNVDINSADAKQLSELNGIGAKKASAIVAYRKTHCFKDINELSNVKGIGKKTVAKNSAVIIVGKCKK